MSVTIAESVCNAALDLIGPAIDAGPAEGVIEIRTGPPPANTAAADTGTLLSTLTFSDPSMNAASGREVEADTISPGNIVADGVAAHFRVKTSTGTVVLQGTVGTSGTDMILNTTTFTDGGVCTINSFVISLGV